MYLHVPRATERYLRFHHTFHAHGAARMNRPFAPAGVDFVDRPRDVPLTRQFVAEQAKLTRNIVVQVIAHHRHHADILWRADK